MRWDELFADLNGQARAAEVVERDTEVAERVRWESGRGRLLDRVRAAGSRDVQLGLVGASDPVAGRLLAVGADWLAVLTPSGETLVPRSSLRSVRFPPRRSADPRPHSLDSSLHPRLRLPHATRRLARDRARVQVRTLDDGVLSGTVDRAGLDHFELAEHAADLARRASAVRVVTLLPYTAVLWVRGGSLWSPR